MRRAVAASVRAVAVPTRSSDWPTHSSTRSSSKIRCAASGAPRSRMSAYTSAKSPTRIAIPSPKRRAGPRHDASSCCRANWRCTRVAAAPDLGTVHDVVVHERERVHELERGAALITAGSSRSPPAPTNAHAQNAGAAACRRRRRTRAALRADRRARRRLRSSASARWRAAIDARLDPIGDRIERFGKAAVRAAVGAMARGYVVGSEAPVSSPGGVSAERSMHLVADFLSDEWIAALAAMPRCRRRRVAAGDRLVIEPVVAACPAARRPLPRRSTEPGARSRPSARTSTGRCQPRDRLPHGGRARAGRDERAGRARRRAPTRHRVTLRASRRTRRRSPLRRPVRGGTRHNDVSRTPDRRS